MKTLAQILVLALLPACLACTQNPEIDLAGTWRGQWTAGGTAGSLEVTFAGKRAFGGTGDRTVAFNQDEVHFAVSLAAGSGGDGTFLFDGSLNGGREIDGNYRLSSDSCSACTCGMGPSGTWTVLR